MPVGAPVPLSAGAASLTTTTLTAGTHDLEQVPEEREDDDEERDQRERTLALVVGDGHDRHAPEEPEDRRRWRSREWKADRPAEIGAHCLQREILYRVGEQ